MLHQGQDQRLVYMANQITTFFAYEPDEPAVAAIESHIRKFWDPRMRAKIIAYVADGGDGLLPRAQRAIRQLQEMNAIS
ncbi:formate dehydrogenase subunit delta [Acidiphilium sp. AL]|nr:formate dehydrogenase subunit delta [Acidiphilium sp. AL]